MEYYKYLSDPFGIRKNGRIYLFCEEFDYRFNKGRIVYYELGGPNPSGCKVAIELPVHMSYPYLLERAGEIYCIPETARAREIMLFKAEEFPHKWVKCCKLVSDFPGLDNTVFEHGGRWWLASVDLQQQASLFIWHAPDMFGPWTPHSGNPVKRDIASVRSAGTPFVHHGFLYRPAQDCSRTYGGRIILNRILRLTPDEFKEEPAALIEPFAGPYPYGLHTISSLGKITLLDGKRFIFDKGQFKRSLRIGINEVRSRLSEGK